MLKKIEYKIRYRSELASTIIQVQNILPDAAGYVQGMAIVSALVSAIHQTLAMTIVVLLTVTIFEYSKQYLINK